MPVNKRNIRFAAKYLGADHARLIVRLAKKQDMLEMRWDRSMRDLGSQVAEDFIQQVAEGKEPKVRKKIFQEFILKHYFEVVGSAAESATEELQVIDKEKRMAKPRMPRSLAEVRKIYDRWRRTGVMPKGLNQQAKKIQSKYLDKVQKVWRRYSEDYRAGEDSTKEQVIVKIRDAADVATSRAKVIVRTETTNYYNATRTEIYDQVDGVWGYLFLAIRDQGTTKWCTDRVRGGKRGRHGLVYKKDHPLTKKERPSCHWYCRSEFTPLTIYNPRHLKLIEDLSLRRENNICHPLPEGWRASA